MTDTHASFEPRLIDALQPLRFHMLATTLYHLFETGLFDSLKTSGSATLEELAECHNMDSERLAVFCSYLRNEGYLDIQDGQVSLSRKGAAMDEFRPWYTMLVGGYAESFMQVGEKLQRGSGSASRDLPHVGIGSCGISHYDAIPLTRSLMNRVPGQCTRMLDMGCGNGRYLVEFCQALPEIDIAWGVEPSLGSCQDAIGMVERAGLQDRINIIHSPAIEFLDADYSYQPNFAVLGFVLHEILGQEGRDGVRQFINKLMRRFPEMHLIIIEVDNQIDHPDFMKHGLSQAYYNGYYLLHPFTNQRLETTVFWEELFAECELEVIAKEFTNPTVDSTQLEVGYLLRKF